MSARQGPTKHGQHRGSRSEPLTVDEFESWFDVLAGPEGRSLKQYPETLDSVHVRWRDAEDLVHHPETFEDLIEAYRSELTGTVEVGTMGAKRPRVQASSAASISSWRSRRPDAESSAGSKVESGATT